MWIAKLNYSWTIKQVYKTKETTSWAYNLHKCIIHTDTYRVNVDLTIVLDKKRNTLIWNVYEHWNVNRNNFENMKITKLKKLLEKFKITRLHNLN